jgi:Tfp pilus assembly protein PilV
MRSSNGVTVVEVVIATLVLSIGLLGLVATAGVTTRMVGQGSRYSDVSALAMRRLEILRSQGCDGISNGSRTRGRFTETWTVQTLANGRVRAVEVVVNSPVPAGILRDTFATMILC